MRKRKWSKVGWIHADEKHPIKTGGSFGLGGLLFHIKRGPIRQWRNSPPRKVRVTVEEI
jgi:hypothetical protein